MPLICPTITANNPHDYRMQLERILPFAPRIHVDLMDGDFAQPRGVSVGEIYWPEGTPVDVHIMYRDPTKYMRKLWELQPFSVIVHAESDGDFVAMAQTLRQRGIGVGVALLPETPVEAIAPALELVDHVLIFSGKLGHFGGVADLRLLVKAKQLLAIKPTLEIGWDGGINESNVKQLVAGGVDVLNVGGYVQHATDPAKAYATLEALT